MRCWQCSTVRGSPHLNGEGYRCWVADSGAQVGDAIAMKRQGSWVLVRLVPADTGKQPASVDRSDRPAPADEAERPALAAQAAAPASAGGACPGQDVSQQGSPDAPARQADQCSAEQHVKVGASRRSRWAHAGDGWWHTRLSATACGATASPIQLRLPAGVFEQVAGRAPGPVGSVELLEVASEATGFSYSIGYRRRKGRTCYLSGNGLAAWVEDSGAQPGDAVALRRQGDRLLVKLIPTARLQGRGGCGRWGRGAGGGAAG